MHDYVNPLGRIEPAGRFAPNVASAASAGWWALIATCLSALLFSSHVRHVITLLLKIAWLYMVTGARG